MRILLKVGPCLVKVRTKSRHLSQKLISLSCWARASKLSNSSLLSRPTRSSENQTLWHTKDVLDHCTIACQCKKHALLCSVYVAHQNLHVLRAGRVVLCTSFQAMSTAEWRPTTFPKRHVVCNHISVLCCHQDCWAGKIGGRPGLPGRQSKEEGRERERPNTKPMSENPPRTPQSWHS